MTASRIYGFNFKIVKLMIEFLHKEARSKTQLAELTGFKPTTVSRYIRMLSTGNIRFVFIEYYVKDKHHQGLPTAFWRWGVDQKDAKYPPPINRKYHVRTKPLQRVQKLRNGVRHNLLT